MIDMKLWLDSAYPCPFCGSTELSTQISNEDREEGIPTNVVCCKCGGSGGFAYCSTTNITEAIKNWNQRASYDASSSVVSIINKFDILASG
jgi:Lar family restriction alleviation protein